MAKQNPKKSNKTPAQPAKTQPRTFYKAPEAPKPVAKVPEPKTKVEFVNDEPARPKVPKTMAQKMTEK